MTTEKPPLSLYRLVLVRTVFPGNLGACGRAAANFDVRDTVMVSAFASTEHPEAKRNATNAARDYMRDFKSSKSLQDTVKDCKAAIGFSVRTGTTRSATIALNDIPALVSTYEGERVALIFGNEQDGLSGDELLQCTHVCQLATSPVHPSLNLSHAVAIVLARLYDVHMTLNGENPVGDATNPLEKPIMVGDWQTLMNRFEQLMLKLGPYDQDPERVMTHLRRILGRTQLKAGELKALNTFIDRLSRDIRVDDLTNKK